MIVALVRLYQVQTRFGICYSGEDAAAFPAVCCIRPLCRDIVPYGAGGVVWVPRGARLAGPLSPIPIPAGPRWVTASSAPPAAWTLVLG